MSADAVARLWARFRPLVTERLSVIQDHLDGDPAVSREAAVRAAHNLAGSLGSYGRPEGSVLARRIEEALGGTGAPEDPAGLQALAARLRAAVED
ncbi:Hpt domain-containing protein [Blastococcus sp. SYSU D00820]